MPDVFNSRPGSVAIVPSDFVIPGKVHISGFEPAAALIAGIDYIQNTNQQFQTSLDGAVYLYVFGDQMGTVNIHGIAFPVLCDGAKEGILEVLKFYAGKRASAQPNPIEVQIGSSEVISGFLTSVRIMTEVVAEDPGSFLNKYTLTINALPQL